VRYFCRIAECGGVLLAEVKREGLAAAVIS
jgi:hypothetical protein